MWGSIYYYKNLHTYIHTYIHTYTHIYMHISLVSYSKRICTYIHTYMHVSLVSYSNMYTKILLLPSLLSLIPSISHSFYPSFLLSLIPSTPHSFYPLGNTIMTTHETDYGTYHCLKYSNTVTHHISIIIKHPSDLASLYSNVQ